MYVTVRLAPDAEGTEAFNEVLESAHQHGLHLEKMRSVRPEAQRRPFYSAPTSDKAAAEAFLAKVKRSPALEAAYLKPADALA